MFKHVKTATHISAARSTSEIDTRSNQLTQQQAKLQQQINALKKQLPVAQTPNDNKSNGVNNNQPAKPRYNIVYDSNANGFESQYDTIDPYNLTEFQSASAEYLNQIKQQQDQAINQLNTGLFSLSTPSSPSLLSSILLNDNVTNDINLLEQSTNDTINDTVKQPIGNNITASVSTEEHNTNKVACYQCYALCWDTSCIPLINQLTTQPILVCSNNCVEKYKSTNNTTKCSVDGCNRLASSSTQLCKICTLHAQLNAKQHNNTVMN